MTVYQNTAVYKLHLPNVLIPAYKCIKVCYKPFIIGGLKSKMFPDNIDLICLGWWSYLVVLERSSLWSSSSSSELLLSSELEDFGSGCSWPDSSVADWRSSMQTKQTLSRSFQTGIHHIWQHNKRRRMSLAGAEPQMKKKTCLFTSLCLWNFI